MEVFEKGAPEALHAIVDRALPPICVRPEHVLDLPRMLLADIECLRAALSRAIGLAIVLFAGIIKLPQIAAILSAKSVAGLSVTTFLVETFGYTYNLAAHYRQDYPVSTYGDFCILILQNYYLLYLCFSYTNRTARGFAVIAAYVSALALLCSPYFPLEALRIMTLGNVAVVVVGRVPQIYANFSNGGTGALSILTCWGIFLGACARIFTTLQDVDSKTILAGYVTSATLNGIIAFQVAYYRYFVRTPPVAAEKKVA